MSGIRGEVRPHDAASGENRRRNAATGHQPLGQVTEIDAADGNQAAVASPQHPSSLERVAVNQIQDSHFS